MVEGHFNMMTGSSVALSIPDVPEGAEFENLGTTVEVVMEGFGGGLTLADGTNYNLSQFHFHHPSEHIDNGVSMPMEMHMVFQSEDNRVAVIGVYVDTSDDAAEAGGANEEAANSTLAVGAKTHLSARNNNKLQRRAPTTMLETVFASVGEISEPGTVTKTAPLVMSEIVDLLTAGNFQAYDGSLTTPPCTEEVSWLVSTKTLVLSTSTFVNARSVLGFNSRYPQNTPGQPNLLSMTTQA